MLRAPGSNYEGRRSSAMLKLKRLQQAEAVVIGHEKGSGRCAGVIGAIIVELSGAVFRIGSGLSDLDRIFPPAVGDHVTFSFFGLTDGGIPRHPSFIAVRDYE